MDELFGTFSHTCGNGTVVFVVTRIDDEHVHVTGPGIDFVDTIDEWRRMRGAFTRVS